MKEVPLAALYEPPLHLKLHHGLLGSLEREIDIDLPEYSGQVVVECYLEAGKPYNLLLTQSAGFFDPIDTSDPLALFTDPLEQGAQVHILYRNDTVILENADPLIYLPQVRRFANYYSSELVPMDFDNDFHLDIITQNGGKITGTTRLLPVVPIDSVVVEADPGNDTTYRLLTYFTDDQDQDNYYRRILNYATLDSVPDQDFVTDDRFVEDVVVFGTGYDLVKGDTAYNTLFHIDEAHYDFSISVFNAISANGNPFAQPGRITSNVYGPGDPIGIFTGLSYDRVITIIE